MIAPITRLKKINFLLSFFFVLAMLQMGHAQNCSLNAGVPETICENVGTFNLSGSSSGLVQSGPTWSQVGGPSVIIDDPNNLSTLVNGLVGGNTYTFRLTGVCTDGTTQFQDVTITVQPITVADAGNDIASCPDNSGSITTNANTPLNTGEIGQWSIVGNNNAGVTINSPSSPTTSLSLAETNAGVTTLQWTITGPDYTPGQFCESSATISITNYGGVSLVSAGPDQNLDNCYAVTQTTSMAASFGGNNINGQVGTWSFVSGPNVPTIADVNRNNTAVSNLIEGSYVFRWSVSGPCVTGEDTITINVAAATQDISTASIQDDNIRFCDASITTVTLEGSLPQFTGETVTWTQTSGPGGVNILNPNSPTTQISGLDGSSTYVFAYTIENTTTLCSDTATATVRYSTNPVSITANAGSDIVAICGVTSVDIPFTTTGNGDNTYSIINGPSGSALVNPGTFNNTGSTPLNIDFDVEGTYTVLFRRALSGTIQTGCDVATDAINVTVALTPTASNAGTDQNLACNVTSTDITGNTITIGNSLWSQISGPNTATIASPYTRTTNVSNLIPGTYVFQYGISGGSACAPAMEDTVEVVVSSDAPVATDAGLDQTICFGAPTQLDANVPPSTNLVGTWTVDAAPVGATIVFADENNPKTLVSGLDDPNEAYIFRWTIDNPSDPTCPNPGTDTVTISTNATQGPTLADAGPDQCLGAGSSTVTLAGNQPAGDEIGIWTAVPSTGISFDDANQFDTDATITIEQSFILTWTISKITPGCQSTSDEIEITVGANAVANAGPDQTACQSVFIMDATGSVGSSGVWTQVSGPGGYTIDDDTSQTAQITFGFSGQYVFEWTSNNGSCSSDTDQVTLNVGIPPTTATVTTPTETICSSTSVVLDGNVFDNNIETGFWTLLSGAPNTPTFSDINDPNASVTGLVSGTYTFRWTIAGDPNCPASFADKTVNVFVPANAGPDLELCQVQNFLLEATFGSTGTWVQTFGPGVGFPGTPATITQNPVDSNVAEVSNLELGRVYRFTFTTNYPGSTGCGNTSDEVQVESSGLPTILPDAGPDQLLCLGDLVVPNQTTLAGNMPPDDVDEATWSFTEQPTGSTAIITNVNDPLSTITGLTVPGTYILEWNFESGFCFTTSDVMRIEVYETPSTADAGPDQISACQLDAQMNAVPPTSGTGTWTFTVDPSGGAAVIDNPNSPTTTISNITTTGTYTLTWTVAHNGITFVDSPSACDPSSDTVDITFPADAPSTADAGPDQEFCAATQTNMAATAIVVGTGTWTQTVGPGVGGTPGTPANIVSPNSEATLIDTLEPGTYEFTWTVINGGCTFTDTMELVNYADPGSADAGPDQNLDQFSSVTLVAVPATVGVGTWSQISGPTTIGFVNENDPNTDVFGATNGTYVFEWRISNGTCADVFDTVEVVLEGIDLELNKSVLPTSANPGDTVTFTVDVFNNNASSSSDATGVSVRDVIPSGYTLVPGTVSNGGVYNAGDLSLTWSNLSITNGNTLSLTFDATVNPSGNYVNTAEITANDIFDIDSTVNNGLAGEDDQDSAQVTVTITDLNLSKDISAGSSLTPNVGDTVIFELTVSNAGPVTATNIMVEDIVPSGFTIGTINNGGTASTGTITWNIASLPVGSTTVSYEATINAPTGSANEYLNTAEITSVDQFDPDSSPGNDDGDQDEDDEDFFEITPQVVDVELEVLASNTIPDVGDVVTFTINLSNIGAVVATGVSIENLVPAGFETIIGINNGGTYNFGSRTITWTGLTIPVGTNTTILTFNATVQTPAGALGEFTHIAEVTFANQFDSDSTPNNDDGDQSEDDEDAITSAPEQADLSLTKIVVDNDITPSVGDEISFEITISNSGPSDATNVVVTDLLPTGFDFVLYSATAGTYNDTTGEWQLGTLANGASETLIIDVLVNPSGDYVNVAQITASDAFDIDSTPSNGASAEDDQDDVTITPSALVDLSLTKNVDNANPVVNTNVIFTLTVANSGPSDATSIQVTDLLPSGFTYVSDDGGGNYDDTTGVWNVGAIANGGNTSLNITATVNPTGSYTNIAQITAQGETDSDSTPNNGVAGEDDQDQVVINAAPLVDISVTKTADDLTPNVGGQIQFTVTVQNDGPNNATNVVVTDLLASGYGFVSAVPSTGVYESLNGSWTVGNLANSASETLVITADVLANGDYTNIAELTGLTETDVDSAPSNNDDTEDDQETIESVPVLVSDLLLRKSVNILSPLVGEEVIFNISITNNGPSDVTGVEVQDLLPSGYTYVSNNRTAGVYDTGTGIWELNGIIPNGTTETMNIVAIVNPAGDYFNVTEVFSSSNLDPNSTPNNNNIFENDQDSAGTTPIPTADLALDKTVDNEFPDVGSNVTFTITLTNDGPSDATNVVVSDALPTGYIYLSDDSGGTYSATTGLWNVGTIAGGSNAVLNVTVQVNTSGDYNNVAEVVSAIQLDPDSTPGNGNPFEDDQDEQSVTPRSVTDISITKSADNLSPSVGEEIVFTVTVTNSGPNIATGLVIEDVLATGYDLVSAVVTSGTYDQNTGIWAIPSMASGISQTLTVTATVLASGEYSNTAELIRLDTFDPDSTPDNRLSSEDDQDSVVPVPNGLADLSLTKTVNNATPNVGDVVEFTINVTNNGASDATGVVITDILPSGFAYQSYVSTAGTYDANSGIWSLNGTIFNQNTESLVILATVNVPTGDTDEYLNVATITASNLADPDSNPSQGIDQDDFSDRLADDDEASVLVTPQTTDIAVTKTVDNTSPNIGDQVVFTITLTNQGSVSATNIGIEEKLPSGYQLITSQASIGAYDEVSGFWEVNSLDVLGTASLQLTVEILDVNDYLNTASLAFVDQLDVNRSNDSDQAVVEPSCLTVYNEFSPNGDGVNDLFKIDCISRYPNNVLKVYNRWGNIVYEQRSYNNEWDGTSNGRATVQQGDQLPVGTYYYVLDLGDGSAPKTDWLYINR
ncbi:PKD domain-containing protein [Flagellimonas onchidii]|uniref:PKD domain-containing protein n=1 Tax=Flagellimonas onchidii TaxID=2562684 RepID=UPI0010A5B9B3|nr:gliding motility-associated C-terminal domain-containing protein [Allomuricauda onchidii]